MQIADNIVGIIAEYNPFHNGHKFHIEQTKKSTGANKVIAVMSGNFVQRGECALVSKHARTLAALQSGVDVVVELQTPWSTASAELFAFGGVYLLNSLGVVDTISFGSESGSMETLSKMAQYVNKEKYSTDLKRFLGDGISFPTAREKALREEFGDDAGTIIQPNNILVFEYLKSLDKLNSKIKPFTIIRTIHHNNTEFSEGDFASATHIRNLVRSGNVEEVRRLVPKETYDILNEEIKNGFAPATLDNNFRGMMSVLRYMSKESLLKIPDVSEGLENKILDGAKHTESINELYSFIKSKRYTLSRVRRIVLNSYLGITNELVACPPPYIKILGFRKDSSDLISKICKNATLPVVARTKDAMNLTGYAKQVWEKECDCYDQYGLFTPTIMDGNLEQTSGIITV